MPSDPKFERGLSGPFSKPSRPNATQSNQGTSSKSIAQQRSRDTRQSDTMPLLSSTIVSQTNVSSRKLPDLTISANTVREIKANVASRKPWPSESISPVVRPVGSSPDGIDLYVCVVKWNTEFTEPVRLIEGAKVSTVSEAISSLLQATWEAKDAVQASGQSWTNIRGFARVASMYWTREVGRLEKDPRTAEDPSEVRPGAALDMICASMSHNPAFADLVDPTPPDTGIVYIPRPSSATLPFQHSKSYKSRIKLSEDLDGLVAQIEAIAISRLDGRAKNFEVIVKQMFKGKGQTWTACFVAVLMFKKHVELVSSEAGETELGALEALNGLVARVRWSDYDPKGKFRHR